ncbi:ADP-ribosylglycohydrolase family protein [Roseomonas sp. GCM10028921]
MQSTPNPAAALEAALLDRARGTLLGLAVGDALGTTLEFSRRDAHPLHTEMTGGGPFRLAPGVWTDDTSMALALAENLVEHPGFEPRDLMGRFLAWWREGAYSPTSTCFDIGIATREALARYERDGDPFAGTTDPRSAGNGSLMRLAPAVLVALDDAGEVRRIAEAQSRTTHATPQAVEACALLAGMMREAILGAPRAQVLAPRLWEGDAAIAAIAEGTWRGRSREAIRSSGYVVHTLEAALWAVERTESFEEALVLAVNLGDDADSVGAVTGQLAGAIYGLRGIPPRWLAPLAWRERLTAAADALVGARVRA